jgi:hypothetical protein
LYSPFGRIQENPFLGKSGVHANKEVSRSTRFFFARRSTAKYGSGISEIAGSRLERKTRDA